MEQTSTTLPIVQQVKHYLETKFKLLKYEGIDKASAIIAELITDLVMAILLLITFVFLSVTLALFAGTLLQSDWEGFGCVTLLYVVIVLSVRLLKVRLRNRCIRLFIEKIFKQRS